MLHNAIHCAQWAQQTEKATLISFSSSYIIQNLSYNFFISFNFYLTNPLTVHLFLPYVSCLYLACIASTQTLTHMHLYLIHCHSICLYVWRTSKAFRDRILGVEIELSSRKQIYIFYLLCLLKISLHINNAIFFALHCTLRCCRDERV